MNTANRPSAQRERVRDQVIEAWDQTAISWLGSVAMIPGMLITDAAFAVPATLPLGFRVGIAGVAWVAMTVTLLVLAPLLDLMSRGWPRRLAVLATYAIAGLARISVLAWFIERSAPGFDRATATPVRLVGTVVWLSAVAVLVAALRRSGAQVERLQAERRRLEITRQLTQAELAATAERLARVRRLVGLSIEDARAALNSAATRQEIATVADRLADTVQRLVRPASHQLATRNHPGVAVTEPELVRLTWRQQVVGIARAWPSAEPFQPVAVLALTGPISVAAVLFQPWTVVEFAQLGAVAVQVIIVWVAARTLPPLLARLTTPAGIGVVATVYALLALFGLAAASLLAAWGGHPRAETALLAFTAAASVGGGAALDTRLRRAERETERARDETSWQLGRIQQQLWAERRRLAIALHGQVQATLTACEFLLRRWLDDPSADDLGGESLMNRVAQALTTAAAVGSGADSDTVGEGLAEVVQTWDGILGIEVDLQPAAEAALNADPDGRVAAVEVVRELLLNAARHGRARFVKVQVRLWQPRVIDLTVVEHGDASTGEPTVQRNGLGRRLLDETTLGWAAHQHGNSRTTEVRLATTVAPAST